MRVKAYGVVLASLVLLGARALEPAIEQRDDYVLTQVYLDRLPEEAEIVIHPGNSGQAIACYEQANLAWRCWLKRKQ